MAFSKLKQIEENIILNKKLDFAESIRNIYNEDMSPYFSVEWIEKNILK